MVVCLFGAMAVAPAAVGTGWWPPAIVERDVSFAVTNTNTTRVRCSGDDRQYVVRGHLAMPASQPAAVTVYVHGSGDGSPWHLQTVAGNDYITELAKLGHASLALDSLGYGESDLPDGNDVCYGSIAGITHQIIAMLRTGEYDGGNGSGSGPAFAGVAIAGHSIGGAITEVTAASFPPPAGPDAIAVVDWAGEGFPAHLLPSVAVAGLHCAQGGEPKRPGGPNGYARTFSDADLASPSFSWNTEPSVVDAYAANYERDPCGVVASSDAIAMNHALEATIGVPVLLAFGDPGLGWSPGTYEVERAHFAGSADVRLLVVPDCSHLLMLCRTAPTFRLAMHQWLGERGF